MKYGESLRMISLFCLFFLLQWVGQLAAARAAIDASVNGGGRALFLTLLYACFLTRGMIWILILRKMKLSLAYTLSSLSYLIIPLLSHLIFQEVLKIRYIPAGLLILSGITLFGLGEQKKRDKHGI